MIELETKNRFKSHHDVAMGGNKKIATARANKEELFKYLVETKEVNERQCIYIHVPWCDKICSFCNLMRKQLEANVLNDYVAQVEKQCDDYGQTQYIKNSNIETIFFGGGTPTVLGVEHFDKILKAIRKNFKLADDCQISVESTLHNLSKEKVEGLREIGVNRFSIGIQTFNDEGRKFFNRTYDQKEVIRRLKEIRSVFPGYIAIDKIYNYKGETKESLLEDVNIIKDLKLDSVSFYSLQIQEGSALSKEMEEQDLSDKADLEFHNLFVDTMLECGEYEVMEITKIVRKGRDDYKYIQVRHAGGDTIPLGKNAGGNIGPYGAFLADFQMWMVSNTTEPLMPAFRKINGMTQKHGFIPEDYEKYFTESQFTYIKEIMDMYCENGYFKIVDGQYIMTSEGLFYGNNLSKHIVHSCIDKFTEGK